MPFRSEKQRRFMYANHPDIAKRWEDKYGSTPRPAAPRKAAKKAARINRHKGDRPEYKGDKHD